MVFFVSLFQHFLSFNFLKNKGVDDSISECDLDSVCKFDFEIINNDDSQMNETMQILIDFLKQLYKINF